MENIMPTVFVTGANRGLGFEHVKQYAKKNWEIIATSRNPEQSTELLQLSHCIFKGSLVHVPALRSTLKIFPVQLILLSSFLSKRFKPQLIFDDPTWIENYYLVC